MKYIKQVMVTPQKTYPKKEVFIQVKIYKDKKELPRLSIRLSTRLGGMKIK